jgi:hypothetical protein
LIALLGQILRHQMEGTIQRKETIPRNTVDKPPCVKQGGVHQKRKIL